MNDPVQASLTWKMYQRGTWLLAATTMPASSAARVAAEILRTFAGKSFTPSDVSVVGWEVKRFSYRSDGLALSLRRLPERPERPERGHRTERTGL